MNRLSNLSFGLRCTLALLLLTTAVWMQPAAAQDKAGNKKATDTQEKGAPKSPPEALNLFADAASFQNNGAFELGAEEWEKFLKKYPDDPLATKARHYAGICHLQLKRFDRAAEHFAAVLAKDEKFELAEDASINLSWCQFSLAGQGKQELYEAAIQTLTAHLTRFPKGKLLDQALFYLGESYFAQGKRAEAIQAYRRLIEEQPKSPLRPDGLYALGVTLEQDKQYPEAGAVYDIYLKEFPKRDLASEVRMRKGETLFHAGNLKEAEAIFAEVAKLPNFPAADHALFRQADCAARQEQFAPAGELYASVATKYEASPYRADATIAAGRCFYRADQWEPAAKWFQNALALGGKDAAEAAHWLSRIHLKNNEPQKVIELVDQQLPKAQESAYLVHLKMDQADALYSLKEWKSDSIDRFLEIASAHPQHELGPQALYNAAFAALELRKFDQAVELAGRFEQTYPKDRLSPDAKYVAAECQLLSGKLAEAQAAYERLLEQQPDHPESGGWRIRLGLALYLQKQYGEAVRMLESFLPRLKKPEQIAEARFLIGASQFEQNQPAVAAASLEAALTALPKWRQADETLLFLSRAKKTMNKPAEALAAVDRLIAEFPDSQVLDQAHYRRAEALEAAGKPDEAVAAYDVVLTTYPKSSLAPYAAYGKGWARLRAKDFAGASESFSNLLTNYPEHTLAADAYFARAMSRRQAGEFAEAVADVAEFLKTMPELQRKSDALYEQALAQSALKQYDAAAQTLESIRNENKSYAHIANVLYELAWARKNAGKNGEAAAAFASLAKEQPESPLAAEALYHVGEEHYQQKQFAEALVAYTAAQPKATGEVAENVLHKMGWSHFRLSQYEPALGAFLEQVQKFPEGSLAADARFMQAECLFKQQNHKEAWQAFQDSIAMPPASPQMQALAHLHGGQSAGQLQLWKESIELLDAVPAKFADSPYLAEALYERGWAKQNLKMPDEALVDYEDAATKSRSEVGARARFMIGEIEFEKKAFDAAIKSFLRVMYGYGGDNAPELVKKWQGSAGYEAGRCAEVQIQKAATPQEKAKFVQDAKTYYTFVTEKHPDHQLAAQAKERLAALAKLK